MILLDTNIIGTFALLGAMDLLFALFAKDEIGVAPAVYAELVAGVREGRPFLQLTVELVESGKLTPPSEAPSYNKHLYIGYRDRL